MSNDITIPKVEVIDQNGVPVSQERMDPSVVQFIFAAASLSQLVKMRKLEESKVPIAVKPLRRTVTDSVMEIKLDQPWISFSMINDGAGAVTAWVNDKNDPLETSMVASGETYSCNMDFPVIWAVYLKANTGTTAAVRIYGKVGRQNGEAARKA